MTTFAAHKPFLVAIDPGRTTGLAVYGRSKDRIIYLTSGDFFSIQRILSGMFPEPDQAMVLIEHPPQFTYRRNRGSDDRMNRGDAHAFAVGGNRREAELLAGAIKLLGFKSVELVSPINQPKWDQRKFEMFAKIHRQTNEHERDAARLAIYYANKRQEK
jgi:hypothetical protein